MSLGPILRAGVAAIERVVRPERTYVASYNERIRHVHFFLLPRTRSLPAGHVTSDLYRKSRMWLRRARVARNPTQAERASAAARRHWGGMPRLGTATAIRTSTVPPPPFLRLRLRRVAETNRVQ